jgi:DNA-directed RNA polymerase subunit RPC12/RpoP
MKAGQTLEYSMQSQSPVTFLIWNQPFDEFPKDKTITGNYSEVGMTVEGDNDYQYIGYFLQTESTLTFDFTVTGGLIEFFIADAQDLKRWNNWETIYPTVYYPSTSGASDSFSIPHPQDWYIVWYNPLSSSVSVDFNISYEAVGAFDFSDAAVKHEAVEDVDPGTLTVPSSGDWYFFIYFDPFVNPAESVDITFDVSYKTEVTHNDKWLDFQPILLVIGAIIVILLLIAIVQRRSAKRATTAAATTTTPSGEITTTVPSVVKEGKCHRCQFTYKAGDVYCQNCGAKLVGRDYGVSKVSTPATAKNCASCGEALKPGNRYCKNCGAKIKQEKSYEYFPDERKSFFCQLDNEKHPSTDSAYKCVQCSRMVCDDCYDNISKTGLILCPYCKGDLVKAQ